MHTGSVRLTREQLDQLATTDNRSLQNLVQTGNLTEAHLLQIDNHRVRLEDERPKTVEDFDILIDKNFKRFLRQRPHADHATLNFLVPGNISKFTRINKARTFKFEVPWDYEEELPKLFEPLIGQLVYEYPRSLPLEKPVFDRYFTQTGVEKVSCPVGSRPVVVDFNLKIPYQTELPEGYKYVSTTTESGGGWVFTLPTILLNEYMPYTLVISRSKLKALEHWRVAMNTATTFYVSVVQSLPDASRFHGTSVVPLISQYSPDFSRFIPELLTFWVSQGFIPDPKPFTLSTGEVLSFVHERVEDLELS